MSVNLGVGVPRAAEAPRLCLSDGIGMGPEQTPEYGDWSCAVQRRRFLEAVCCSARLDCDGVVRPLHP